MNVDATRARSLFTEAVENHAPDQWHTFLDGACGGDVALRRRVELLLNVHRGEDSFLDRGDEGDRTASPTVDQPPLEKPGTQIGPYKLLQEIGQGGMGVVYMAEQHEPVRRKVALKIIKPGMGTRQVIARFEVERQALSLMDHPNIAKVLDAGTTDSGQPYFVMELVNGIPVTQFCDEQHLTARERLELFIPICQAVQHAHQKGIIHRDIKPSNILIALYDGRPVPKVIDFGVAKATGGQLTEKTMFTGLGQIIGTIEYMSPEQAQRNQLDIDTRSDVYSLGVVLYELLTGDTPFDKQRLRSAAIDELLRIIREEEPPKPSTKLSGSDTLPSVAANRKIEPAKLSALVRGELDWIVMKSLEKDRARRYETAIGFAMDIQRYLNDEAVLACPPSAGYRFRKFAIKNKALLVTSALVATALVVGVIGTTWQAIRATRAEKLAIANEQRAIEERDAKELARQGAQASAEREAEQRRLAEAAATSERQAKEAERLAKEAESAQRQTAEVAEAKAVEEAAIAKAVSDFLQKDLLGLAGAEAQFDAELEPDPELKLATLLDRALIKVEERFTDQPRIRAEIEEVMASAFEATGRYDQSLVLIERVCKYRLETFGERHLDTVVSMSNLAHALNNMGQWDRSVALYQQAATLRKELQGAEHPDSLSAMSSLGMALLDTGKLDPAVTTLTETLAVMRQRLGLKDPNTLSCMNNLGLAFRAVGQEAQAIALFEELLELSRSVLGPDHPKTIITLNNLAVGHYDLGHLEKAIPLAEEALGRMTRLLGNQHPSTLSCMANLASIYQQSGHLDESVALLTESAKSLEGQLGREHPLVLNALSNLASAYQDGEKYEQALPLFEEILKKRQTQLGSEHPDTMHSLNLLAVGYQHVNRMEDALPLLEQVVQLRRSVLGSDHSSTLESTGNLAAAYEAVGRINEAIVLHRQVLDGFRAIVGPDHPQTLYSINNLAVALTNVNDFESAVDVLQPGLNSERLKAATEVGMRKLRIGLLLIQARSMNGLQRWQEAECSAREAMSASQEIGADAMHANALSLLGESLVGIGKCEQAEPLLLEGLSGLKESGQQTSRLREAVVRLVALYEAWGKSEEVTVWKLELQQLDGTAGAATPKR